MFKTTGGARPTKVNLPILQEKNIIILLYAFNPLNIFEHFRKSAHFRAMLALL